MKDGTNTPTLYPLLIVLALFSLGGCFFDGDIPGDLRRLKGKSPRSAEAIFREALP